MKTTTKLTEAILGESDYSDPMGDPWKQGNRSDHTQELIRKEQEKAAVHKTLALVQALKTEVGYLLNSDLHWLENDLNKGHVNKDSAHVKVNLDKAMRAIKDARNAVYQAGN